MEGEALGQGHGLTLVAGPCGLRHQTMPVGPKPVGSEERLSLNSTEQRSGRDEDVGASTSQRRIQRRRRRAVTAAA